MLDVKEMANMRVSDRRDKRLRLALTYLNSSCVWILIDVRGNRPENQLIYRVIYDTHFVILPDDFLECDENNCICLFDCIKKIVQVGISEPDGVGWKNQLRLIEKETQCFSELDVILDYIEQIVDAED